jgi:hypothetical protein
MRSMTWRALSIRPLCEAVAGEAGIQSARKSEREAGAYTRPFSAQPEPCLLLKTVESTHRVPQEVLTLG